jgi:hypothetical protein
MTDQTEPTNLQRLLSHLKPDTLAARLVTAYANATADKRDHAMKEVLKERFSEIESVHAHPENKKN